MSSPQSQVLATPRAPRCLLVTGGAGFIGSSFIRTRLHDPAFGARIINLDLLTYAGNLENLKGHVEEAERAGRYQFVRGDIRDQALMERLLQEHGVDCVVHFAAESHVDRSIHGPRDFIETNVLGTFAILEALRARRAAGAEVHLHHVSTDEVFGSLGDTGFFVETTAYDPRSPYSSSKAASDHLVRAYAHTYGMSTTLSNCSNNYGPYQFPEKLIPLMIANCLEGKPLPVYGDGQNVRDWLYVDDHAEAVWSVLTRAAPGTSWNVGGRNEKKNLDLLHELIAEVARQSGKAVGEFQKLITFVKDRPGHDRRYAIDCSKIESHLGWTPRHDFAAGLEATVRWTLENRAWIDRVRSGAYREWLETNYGQR
ncbi:MAG: dTDP-glucose 4,6-dehydratase [Deltaproteobacteria bacterium]|nr:dTDP-glucose 4,6-dehydratase [Deltaproteobacteria bacterium]